MPKHSPESGLRVLNPEIRRAIDLLIGLPIHEYNRANIVLCLAGVKPLAGLNVPLTAPESGEPLEGVREKVSELVAVLKKSGLSILVEEIAATEDHGPMLGIDLSYRPDGLKKLAAIQAEMGPENPEYHRRLGLLLGYPETAVEAYIGDVREGIGYRSPESHMLPESEYPQDDYMAFCWFGLSKAHWREELKTVRHWAETVKALHPKLYEEVVTYRKEHPR